MKLPRWQKGRQGTGYDKLCLFQSKTLLCDCYLISYPPNTSIPIHTDPVPSKRHYRINILLCGEDKFVGKCIWQSRRIKFFRPDITPHSVDEVSMRRLMLSFGLALPKR